ncbi:MAG: hypothetical protein HOP11_11695 [Saprospiraceae bacterium]|nr:hypothetical protein [Saprospiraceae bacterium]
MQFISNFIKNRNTVNPSDFWDGKTGVQARFEGSFTFSSTNQILSIHRVSETEYGGTLSIGGNIIARLVAFPTPTGMKGKFQSILMSPSFEIIENGDKFYIMQGVLNFDLIPISSTQATIQEENAKQTIEKAKSFAKKAAAVIAVAVVAEKLIDGFSNDEGDMDSTLDQSGDKSTQLETDESLERQREELARMKSNSRAANLIGVSSGGNISSYHG